MVSGKSSTNSLQTLRSFLCILLHKRDEQGVALLVFVYFKDGRNRHTFEILLNYYPL